MYKKDVVKIFLCVIIAGALVCTSRFTRLYNSEAILFEDSAAVHIEERSDTAELIDILEDMGAEFDAQELAWAARTFGWRNYLPGRYEFGEQIEYRSFFQKMALGMQDPVRVVILPGSDPERFSRLMDARFRADSAAFLEIFRDSADLALEHELTGEELFARMLPDSYDFYWTASPESVVNRLLGEFNSRVTEGLAADIERVSFSLNEILTLASITEWEARHHDEKPRITGLYLNRLEQGMLLQADPTVLYALGERRRLLFEDYRTDHPYNTYLHTGLPPGPITNPDLASIRSVLFPESHEYLYMVASPDGYHRFSRTFDEHRQASEEWRRWIQEQYRIRDEMDQDQQDEATNS